MYTGELMCDHCAHEGICKYEKELREYCHRMELPNAKYFIVDIHCTMRLAPTIAVKKKLNMEDFIINQFPEVHIKGEVK